MQLAFAEADVRADDFPSAEENFDSLGRLDENEVQGEHDPLLRTLYLLRHGQVLGKEVTVHGVCKK